MVNHCYIFISPLEFITTIKKQISIYDYIALRLMQHGVKIKEVTNSKVVVAEGQVNVSMLNNTMCIFWYSDKQYLH